MLNFKLIGVLAALTVLPRLFMNECTSSAPCQQWEVMEFNTLGSGSSPLTLDAGWEPFAWDGEVAWGAARHCVR